MVSETSPRRVLVVEDEWLIADEVDHHLSIAGYAVIGPAPSVRSALSLIDEEAPEAALLDISLGDETSYPIAAALTARAIPFAFVTGYAPSEIDKSCADRPCLNKPITAGALLKTVEELFEGEGERG